MEEQGEGQEEESDNLEESNREESEPSSDEEPQNEEEDRIKPRRSGRTRRPPDRYSDCVTSFIAKAQKPEADQQEKLMLLTKLLDFLK